MVWDISKSFKEMGYQQLGVDPCVQVQDVNGEYTLTTTYTDDIYGVSSTKEGVKKAKREIAKRWEINDAEDYELFLGVTVDINNKLGDTSISQ